jgi:hypothetical protein
MRSSQGARNQLRRDVSATFARPARPTGCESSSDKTSRRLSRAQPPGARDARPAGPEKHPSNESKCHQAHPAALRRAAAWLSMVSKGAKTPAPAACGWLTRASVNRPRAAQERIVPSVDAARWDCTARLHSPRLQLDHERHHSDHGRTSGSPAGSALGRRAERHGPRCEAAFRRPGCETTGDGRHAGWPAWKSLGLSAKSVTTAVSKSNSRRRCRQSGEPARVIHT